MSRIISENYSNRLNSLINEFEFSPNLCSLIDFFIDEIQKDQSVKGSKNQKVFSANDLEKLNEISESEELNKIYAYLRIIIKDFQGKYLHIHLNTNLSESIIDNLTTIFVWEALVSCKYDEGALNDEIAGLISKNSRAINLTDANGHSENRLRRERKGWRHKVKLNNQILNFDNSCTINGVLLNLNKSAECSVNLSEFSIFPESLNTYMNFGNNLRNVFTEMGQEKVERLSVILNIFPAISGKNIWYKDFIRDEIMRYTNFKKVITITSGEKTAENLLEMKKQNKFQAEEMYTIFSFEL
jgi:hypothetical protein